MARSKCAAPDGAFAEIADGIVGLLVQHIKAGKNPASFHSTKLLAARGIADSLITPRMYMDSRYNRSCRSDD